MPSSTSKNRELTAAEGRSRQERLSQEPSTGSEVMAASRTQVCAPPSAVSQEGGAWYAVCWDGDWVPEAYRRDTLDFYYAWENIIIREDNCFLYNEDERSISVFAARMGGQTPDAFALAALQRGDEAFVFAKSKVASEDDLIPNMLAFWKAKVGAWRSRFASKEAARTEFHGRNDRMAKMSSRIKQRIHCTPEGELSLGIIPIRFGDDDHPCVAHVLPVLVDEAVDYRVQRIDRCHEECDPTQFNLPEQVEAECQEDSMLLRGVVIIENCETRHSKES